MGFSGLVAVSINSKVVPDLAFFSLLLKEQSLMLSVIVIVLAISLTISSIDTLINAISSLIVVDGSKILNFKGDYLKLSKYFIVCLSMIAFVIASKGLNDPEEAAGPATDYLKMFALVAIGYVWTRYAEISFNKLSLLADAATCHPS